MQQWYQCPNCRAPIAFGVRFCGNCGTQLNWPTQQQPQPPPQYQNQQYQCANCGAPLAFRTRFCGNCGTQLNWPTQQRQPPPQYQQQADYGRAVWKPERQGRSPWTILGLAVVVLFILGGGIILAFDIAPQGTPSPTGAPPVEESTITEYTDIQPPYVKASFEPIHLVNNPDGENVSFAKLTSFILEDDTDEKAYIIRVRTCGDFAEKLHNNAESAGIRAAFVAVHFEDDSVGHALNAFQTTDRGLIYVDCTGPGFKSVSYRQYLYKKAYPCERDRVAYIETGKNLGAISIDCVKSLQYSFYIEYNQKWLQYERMLEDYNNEVARYNQKAREKVYYVGSSEWAAMKAWEAELIEKEGTLNELGSQLGNCQFESLGIVETVEIYW